MEQERLISPPDDRRERKVNERPKSSPLTSSHDAASYTISKRPATAHIEGGASDELSQNERRGSVGTENRTTPRELGKGDNKVINVDVRDSKVDEGWRDVTDDEEAEIITAKYNTAESTLIDNGHRPKVDTNPPKYTVNYSSIHHLIELTEGETDLDSDKEIPDIFSKDDQQQHYTKISGLKDGLIGTEVQPYLEEFNGGVQQEQLMVGKMSLEQVEAEEQRLQTEYLAYQEQEATKQRERQTQIATSEEKAKKEVQRTLRKRRKDLLKKEAQLVQSSMKEKKQVYKAFNNAEQNMKLALKARKGEIKALYGDLERARGYYGAVKGRRWKVDWTKAPQPVQIKIKTLRGIRDKLPASRYLLLVSLHDRLGGHVLRWSKLKGQQWGAATIPVDHQGHFYNTEIKFEQSVYTVLPSKPNISPSMILVFELFILRGPASPTDQVVGWGVFPVCDAEFNIIEGRYKCPLLRGPIDPLITKHSKLEGLLSSDLENWLSNLYFEVVKLPRYLQGMHEYEVELQFTSSLLGQPDRTHDENDVIDGNEPILGTDGDMFSSTGDVRPLLSPPPASSESASIGGETDLTQFSDMTRTGLTSRLSRRRFQSGYASDSDRDSSSDEESSERSSHQLTREEEGFVPVDGKEGLFYKVHEFNPFAEQRREIQTLLPHSSVLEENTNRRKWARKKKPKTKLSYENELKQHTISIHPPFSSNGRVKRKMYERLQYLGRQLISEMGLSQWRSLEFWSMIVIFILCWWVRLYMHYIAQFSFLRISDIPVSRFELYPHTVLLHYQSSLLFTREEVAIVLLGPFFNTFIFCCFILLSWLIQKIFVSFPDVGSLFIATFGVQVILDPYWILLVDMALLRFNAPQSEFPTADVTKLYWHFERLEGNGVVGIFLVLFLYIFTTFVTLACFYMYFLRVHMNGKLIDIYHRLKSTEEKFFIPHDLELSNEELGYICRKAEQWRGADGERRKVAVHDYIWEEQEDNERKRDKKKRKKRRRKKEVTTHISIYTLHLDGFRELYRHFLRLDDGAITEIFGDISSVAGISININRDITYSNKHSLTSFDHSEINSKDGGGSTFGDLSHVPFPPVPDQSTPTHSLNDPDRESFISVPEHEEDSNFDETMASFEQHHMEYMGHNSLEVPEQTLTSPYNRHRGAEYDMNSSYTKLSAHGDALEVSLSIPDHPYSHSETEVFEDASYSVKRFNSEHTSDVCHEQQERVEYCANHSGQETSNYFSLNSTHVNVSSEHHSKDKAPLSGRQENSDGASVRGKVSLEKKLSAGQLV